MNVHEERCETGIGSGQHRQALRQENPHSHFKDAPIFYTVPTIQEKLLNTWPLLLNNNWEFYQKRQGWIVTSNRNSTSLDALSKLSRQRWSVSHYIRKSREDHNHPMAQHVLHRTVSCLHQVFKESQAHLPPRTASQTQLSYSLWMWAYPVICLHVLGIQRKMSVNLPPVARQLSLSQIEAEFSEYVPIFTD